MRAGVLAEYVLRSIHPRGPGVYPVAPVLAARARWKSVLGLLARAMESLTDDALAARPWEASSVWEMLHTEYVAARASTLEVVSWIRGLDTSASPAREPASPGGAADAVLRLLGALRESLRTQDLAALPDILPAAFSALDALDSLLRQAGSILARVPWGEIRVDPPQWLNAGPSRTDPPAV